MDIVRTGLALGVFAGLLGCGAPEATKSADPAPVAPEVGSEVTDQIEFDFSLLHDREQFVEDGLLFRSSIGPYAVYEVTGPAPRLQGPLVRYPAGVGYAMLCAAQAYFTPDPVGASPVTLGLVAGASVFVETQMAPMMQGLCVNPSDDYGGKVPVPDSGSSGGEPSGGTDLPEAKLAKISIDIGPDPEIGSTFLLRRIALSVEQPGHNGSHAIPKICCDGEACGLDKLPPSGPPK